MCCVFIHHIWTTNRYTAICSNGDTGSLCLSVWGLREVSQRPIKAEERASLTFLCPVYTCCVCVCVCVPYAGSRSQHSSWCVGSTHWRNDCSLRPMWLRCVTHTHTQTHTHTCSQIRTHNRTDEHLGLPSGHSEVCMCVCVCLRTVTQRWTTFCLGLQTYSQMWSQPGQTGRTSTHRYVCLCMSLCVYV